MEIDFPSLQEKTTMDAETQTLYTQLDKHVLRKKVRSLKQNIRRRKSKKITSMQDLIQSLKENGCTTDNLTTILENYFSGMYTNI